MSLLSTTKDSIQSLNIDQQISFIDSYNEETNFISSCKVLPMQEKPSNHFFSPPLLASSPAFSQGFISNNMSSNMEIDVKPKARHFTTKEEKRQFTAEYKKKIKTELCKTFTITGYCKFGDYCSFAHGKDELKDKIHLSTNYKTKPCKQYFFQGLCPYGYRCQYMHNEIKRKPEKVMEFQEFLVSAYNQKNVSINFLSKMQYGFTIKLKKFINLMSLHDDIGLVLLDKRKDICESLEEKLRLTQKLLDKLDREFDFPKNHPKDFKQFLDKSTDSFHIYELCANEFCFELEILQLPIISLFFKRYIQGYHCQISCLLKLLTENTLSIPITQEKQIKNEFDLDINEENLDNYQVKKKDASTKRNSPNEKATKKSIVKLKSKNSPRNSKMEMKLEQTNILLRTEISSLSMNNDQLKKQNLQLKEMVSKIENQKQSIEEELLRTVKSNIVTQNFSMNSNNDTNKKINIEEFLFTYNKQINEQKQKETMKAQIKNFNQSDENKYSEERDVDELNIAEMKMMLEKKDKTIEKVKDSGVSKELKQVLKGISKKNKNIAASKHSENVFIESEEDGEEEEKEAKNDLEMNNLILKTKKISLMGKRKNKAFIKINSQMTPKHTKEQFTQPDKLIFDIDIIDALNYKIVTLTNEIKKLNQETQNKSLMISIKEDEKNSIKKNNDQEKLKSLEAIKRITNLEMEINKNKKEISVLKTEKGILDEKIINYNEMVEDLDQQLKEKNSNSTNQDKTNYKLLSLQIKQELSSKTQEFKALTKENANLLFEITCLKEKLKDLLQEKLSLQINYCQIQTDFDELLNELQSEKGLLNQNNDKEKIGALEKKLNGLKTTMMVRMEDMSNLNDNTMTKINDRSIPINNVKQEEKNYTIEKDKIKTKEQRKLMNSNEILKEEDRNGEKTEKIARGNKEIVKKSGGKKIDDKIDNNEKDLINNEKKNILNKEKFIEKKEKNNDKIIENKDKVVEKKVKNILNIENKEKIIEKKLNTLEKKEKITENHLKDKIIQKINEKKAKIIEKTPEKQVKNKQNDTLKPKTDNQEKIIEKKTENSVKIAEKILIKSESLHKIEEKNQNEQSNKSLEMEKISVIQNPLKSLITDTSKILITNPQNPLKFSLSENTSMERTHLEITNSDSKLKNEEDSFPLKSTKTEELNLNSFTDNQNISIVDVDNKENMENLNVFSVIENKKEKEKKVAVTHQLLNNKEDDKLLFEQEKKYLQDELESNKNLLDALQEKLEQISEENTFLQEKIVMLVAKTNERPFFEKFTQTSFHKKTVNIKQSSSKKSQLTLLDSFFFDEKNKLLTNPTKYTFESVKNSENLLINMNFSKFKEVEVEESENKYDAIFNLMKKNVESGTSYYNPEELIHFEKFFKEKRVPKYEEFKEIMIKTIEEHKKCGPKCPHLTRFYDKIGFSEQKLNRKLYKIHKRNLSRLPRILTGSQSNI